MKLAPTLLTAAAALALALPAAAHEQSFLAMLSGAAEAPPNGSAGTGMAQVTVDHDLMTMHVEASFSSLSAGVSAAHIHCCTATPGTGTAGVATPVPTFPGFPSAVTSGSYDQVFDLTQTASWNGAFITANGGTPASAFTALLAGFNAGTTYFNVHTTEFPGGEIRGFLAAPIPEPSTYAMLLAGLGVIGIVARRRRVS